MAPTVQLSSDLILTAVARYHGLPVSTLEGPRQDRDASTARHIAMHLLHILLGLSAEEIGTRLGGRERTTVVYGLQRTTERLKDDTTASIAIDTIREHLRAILASEGEHNDQPESEPAEIIGDSASPRTSILVQAKVAQIGAIMGFSIWVPTNDRSRVLEQVSESMHDKFLRELDLGYDMTTLSTIHNIDVLWLNRKAIIRAFEIEDTTRIYSGLLRMADLLALQPNINIKLHIVANEDRQEKALREITRPVFVALDLPQKCSFLSYAKIGTIANHADLRFLRDDIISSYEVWA